MTVNDHDLDDFEDHYPEAGEPQPEAQDDADHSDLVDSEVEAPRRTPLLIVAVVLTLAVVLIGIAVGIAD